MKTTSKGDKEFYISEGEHAFRAGKEQKDNPYNPDFAYFQWFGWNVGWEGSLPGTREVITWYTPEEKLPAKDGIDGVAIKVLIETKDLGVLLTEYIPQYNQEDVTWCFYDIHNGEVESFEIIAWAYAPKGSQDG